VGTAITGVRTELGTTATAMSENLSRELRNQTNYFVGWMLGTVTAYFAILAAFISLR
jgi:hypothetical protein